MSTITLLGGIKNLSPGPDIGFQFQDDGSAWPSVIAAHEGTPEAYRAVGKVRFIDQGQGLKEYWYKGGVELVHLVPRYENLDSAESYVNELNQIKSDTETLMQETAAIKDIAQAQYEFKGDWNVALNTPALTADATAGQTNSEKPQRYVIKGTGNLPFDIKGMPAGTPIGPGYLVQHPDGQWFYDTSETEALKAVEELAKTIQPNTSAGVLLPIKDKVGRILTWFTFAGKFGVSRWVDETIPRSAIESLDVKRQDLHAEVSNMIFKPLDPSTGYIGGIFDKKRRKLFAIRTSGVVEIPRLKYDFTTAANGIIPKRVLGALGIESSDLGPGLSSLVFRTLDPSTGYIGGFFDKKRRKLLAIRTSGAVEIPRLIYTQPNGSISEQMLAPSVLSKLDSGGSNINARLLAPDDELNRGGYVDIAVKLSYNGSQFVPFRRVRTPFIQGINKTGQTLEFRRSSGLTFRARKYAGTYDVPAIIEVSYKGDTNSAPPTAGRLAGDWFRIGTLDKATLTINGVAYQSGDIAVWDGVSAFVRKAAPSPSGESRSGDFWVVTTPGVFDGISYAIGDVIYMESRRAAGGPFYRYYNKGNNSKGEFFFAGSFTPASFPAPQGIPNGVKYQSSADPVIFDAVADGMVYIASAAGTYNAKNFAKNDMLVRIAGNWSLLPSEPVKTVLPDEFISLRCDFANEWEVRRADVANTGYGGSALSVILKSAQSFVPKSSVADLVIDGDSMVGALATLPALLAPRVVTTRSWGGGTSEDIVNEIEREIRKTDSYKARAHGFYHGQNNVNDLGQILYMCDRMIELAGARDATFFFLSVLGDRYMTYNGTRMVAAMQEGAFAQDPNNAVFKIEQAYEQKYKGNWINIRKHLLASAATLTEPDLLQPGKTQAQTAAEFGQLPLSYFLDYTALPYPAGQLVHVGYQTVDATPTGGEDKDYYIATYGVNNAPTIGALWIRSSGVWNLYTWDRVHVLASVRPLFAQAVQNWLSTNKL